MLEKGQAVAASTWQGPLFLSGKGWYFHYVWGSVVQTSVNVTTGDALLPREQPNSSACTFALIMQEKAGMLFVAPDDE